MKIYLAGAQKALVHKELKEKIDSSQLKHQLESYYYIKTNIDKIKEIVSKYEAKEEEGV